MFAVRFACWVSFLKICLSFIGLVVVLFVREDLVNISINLTVALKLPQYLALYLNIGH